MVVVVVSGPAPSLLCQHFFFGEAVFLSAELVEVQAVRIVARLQTNQPNNPTINRPTNQPAQQPRGVTPYRTNLELLLWGSTGSMFGYRTGLRLDYNWRQLPYQHFGLGLLLNPTFRLTKA